MQNNNQCFNGITFSENESNFIAFFFSVNSDLQPPKGKQLEQIRLFKLDSTSQGKTMLLNRKFIIQCVFKPKNNH